jgi:hypothetical protein
MGGVLHSPIAHSLALFDTRIPTLSQGLDTVEDDMESFKGRAEEKLAHLRAFASYLDKPGFCMDGVGEDAERELLQCFFNVNASFAALPKIDRDVIRDICARMGEGMAQYCGRDLREGTESAEDYSQYCYYVAGLVGEGLTRLWVAHGDEAPAVGASMTLAHDMGRFLQVRQYQRATRFTDAATPWPLLLVDSAEDKHHPRLPRGLRRGPRVLAQGHVEGACVRACRRLGDAS